MIEDTKNGLLSPVDAGDAKYTIHYDVHFVNSKKRLVGS